jgi:phosphohistidine phosphatase
MSRTLLLVRHSKALQEGASDFVRELAPRGLRDAAVAGAWLRDNDLLPDLAIVSPATRAAQTWAAMAASAGAATLVEDDQRIYDGGAADLLAIVQEVSDEHARVALVGHNPTMHALAHDLDDGEGDADGRTELARAFPTSGIAVFEIAGSWAEASLGSATLRAFTVPRA